MTLIIHHYDFETATDHVEEFDMLNDKTDRFNYVLEVVASGLELEYIRDKFVGIPMQSYKQEISWKDPFAQFIVDNL